MSASPALNLPTEKGREVGLILAEAVACPTHEMCADCVFRHGSFPNQCEDTLDKAMLCLIDPKQHGVFVCAHQRDDGKDFPICGGYAHAMKRALNPLSERNQPSAFLNSTQPTKP